MKARSSPCAPPIAYSPIRDELDAIQSKATKSPADLIRATELVGEVESLSEPRDDRAAEAARRQQLDNLGAPPDLPGGGGFAAALKSAGYDRVRHATVQVESKDVLFSPGSVGDAVRVDRPAPPLGADSRFLHPALPIIGVAPDTTGVSTYKQTGRTLPSPVSSMVRDIAAITEKPQATTTVTAGSEPLHQIAVTSQEIPNVLLAGRMFASWIEADLRFAYATAIDYHVTSEIAAAGPTAAPAGDHIVENVLLASEVVASEGYSPNLLVGSPEFMISLMLATQPISGDYLFSSAGQIDLGLRRVSVVGLDVAYVIDSAALGVLFLSGVTFSTHEEEAGRTNSSTARVESNGLFSVMRLGAVAEIAESS